MHSFQIPHEVKKKNPTECFLLLKEMFDDNCMSHTQVFEWHKQFLKGGEKVEVYERSGFGQPVTSKN